MATQKPVLPQSQACKLPRTAGFVRPKSGEDGVSLIVYSFLQTTLEGSMPKPPTCQIIRAINRLRGPPFQLQRLALN